MNKNIPAVFLDRDGTINRDQGYTYKVNNFQFITGAIEAMFKLKKIGYALILVTNQSGIAKNLFTESQFFELTEWIDWSLINHGVEFNGIYYCPHHPNATKQKYKQICNCRKPKAGMLLAAKKQLNINMKASYMVGNKLSDIQAGKEAGVGTNVLVSNKEKLITEYDKKYADLIIDSLADLPNRIKIVNNN